MGDLGSIPRWERSSGKGNGYPLQYSCLENSMDRGAWWATIHGVTKSRTWRSNFYFHLLWRKDFANGASFWDCAIIIITTIIIPFPLCTQTHNIMKHFSTFSLPSVSFSRSFHWPSNSPSPTFQVFWDSRSSAQTGHLTLGKLFQ